MKKDYVEVDFLRAIAVVLIVFWHCFFCPMYVWGTVEPQADMKFFQQVARFVIVDATMPLFTFISGYLFTALYVGQMKYRSFLPFLRNKINRLFIPFLVFSVLIICTSYNMSFNSLIWGEGCHMWYCAMLFWCFIISWVLLRINNNVLQWVLFLISAVLVFAYPNFWYIPFQLPLGIDNGLYYYSYFALGGCIFMFKDKYKDINVGIIWGVYVILFLINLISLPIISRFCSSLQTYVFSFALWITITQLIEDGKLQNNKKIKDLCKYSFGIYVFHHWLAWDIVWFPPILNVLRDHYFLFPLLLTVVVFALSYFLTEMSFKTRLGKYLLS